MALPGIVLVHGGSHAGDCWQPTVTQLSVHAPGVPVLAVDLPGRRGVPGQLDGLTVDECTTSVVDQIDAAGLDEVVLVGHSMAGLTIPGVATTLGIDRCRRLVFLSCCIPPEGGTVLDTLDGPLKVMAGRAVRKGGVAKPVPSFLARRFFCNGMTAQQRQFALRHLHPDSAGISGQPVSRAGLPREIPRTWILLLADRSLPPSKQRGFIENLGGVDEVVEMDTCHNAMISEPEALARLLADRLG